MNGLSLSASDATRLLRQVTEAKHYTPYTIINDEWIILKSHVENKNRNLLPSWCSTLLGIVVSLLLYWANLIYFHNDPRQWHDWLSDLRIHWPILLATIISVIVGLTFAQTRQIKSDPEGQAVWDRIDRHFTRESVVRKRDL
jgi:hypothetical protein